MSNPFQEQLLKAGMVSKKQVQKANKAKHNSKKQKSSKKAEAPVDEIKLAAQIAAKEKSDRDRELNKQKEDEVRKKALSAEINQLIASNCVERGEDFDIAYNFEHDGKVNRVYINKVMQQQIAQGRLGIAQIDSKYEIVPRSIAEKIQQRDESRIIMIDKDESVDEDDPYADYQVPDDLTW